MDNIRIIFVSIPREDAPELAKNLLRKRLVACINVVPKIESYFWWNDEVTIEKESLLIIKTSQQKIEALIEFVEQEHPYDVPEIIAFPIAEGLPAYISWVIEETGKTERS